jgi:histidinol-phosphate/aromatic aminotransferase/cobyric acid decarboxylase-like protein
MCLSFAGWASNRNRMLFADILDEGTITAAALVRAIDTLADAAAEVGMVAFCSPNNPLGYVITRAEWCRIADVLRTRVPEAIILLDEACACTF